MRNIFTKWLSTCMLAALLLIGMSGTGVTLAAVAGLQGCFAGLTFMLLRVYSLTSVGVSEAGVSSGIGLQGMKDTVVRLPWGMMIQRPFFNQNLRRQGGEIP